MFFAQFSRIKYTLKLIFWPIHKSELIKFIPMSAFMFCLLFNQNILRILKDSIVIPELGAEITSFIKVYLVTPAAALFLIIYAKMVNSLTFEKIFYYLSAVFSIFFGIFAWIIYPNVSFFHLDAEYINLLSNNYPNLKWYIVLVGNWSYMLFYTLSELWPNIFYILLFWQFANRITKTEEAKRFYTLFALFGNLSVILVGFLMMNIASPNSIINKYFYGEESKVILVQFSVLLSIIMTVISAFLVKFMTNNIAEAKDLHIKTKTKMSLIKSFKYVLSSKYLWLLLICAASFSLSMNLVEVVWKAKVREFYVDVNSYAQFHGLYILWTGVVIIFMTIVGNNIMRYHSWFVIAVITPIIIGVTGIIFFILVVFDKQTLSLMDKIFLISPLGLSITIGAIQNIIAKGTKYSVWDASREMLYIPLDNELKTKGKAAVDIVSSKAGKSAAGLIQSILFVIFPSATFITIAPLMMIVFIFVCLIWIYAIRKIYFEYKKLLIKEK